MRVVIDVVVRGVEVEAGVLRVGDCGFRVTVGGAGVGAGAGIVLFDWDYGGEGEWCQEGCKEEDLVLLGGCVVVDGVGGTLW